MRRANSEIINKIDAITAIFHAFATLKADFMGFLSCYWRNRICIAESFNLITNTFMLVRKT